jgi:DNA-binding SARP family transcriptional activator
MELSADSAKTPSPSLPMDDCPRIRVGLLGRLQVVRTTSSGEHGAAVELPARRAQELLCYLLLGGRRPHHREVLAERLWGADGADDPPRGRRYLRQTLWELHRALGRCGSSAGLLCVDPEWIAIGWDAGISSDVTELELAYELVHRSPTTRLPEGVVGRADAAAELYRGDLLEGWYQDWCVVERERCRALYFMLVDRLMAHEELVGDYPRALRYGATLLRSEPAHEGTHRRMMRVYHRLGDRTAALRQYQSCRRVLREELQAAPAAGTMALYERIRADQPLDPPLGAAPAPAALATGPDTADPLAVALQEMCALLEQARAVLGRYLDDRP